MSKHTNIQYTDGTVSPVMGCQQRCELWPTTPQLITAVETLIGSKSLYGGLPPRLLLRHMTPSAIYHERRLLARMIAPPGDDHRPRSGPFKRQ